MKPIGERFQGLSGISYPSRETPKGQSGAGAPITPGETFEKGQVNADWLKRPSLEPEAPPPTRAGMSTGQKVGLVVAGVIVGGGAVAGLSMANQAPQVVVQLSTRDAQKATENFGYLHDVGVQNGGGLKSDPISLLDRVTHHQPEVNAQQAVTSLTQGKTVYFHTPQGSVPIHNVDELKQVTRQVRGQVAENQMRQGIENIKDGLRNVGEQIRDGLDGIFNK